MELESVFDRTVMEAYLAVSVLILTVIGYLVLAGVGFQQQSGFGMLAILLIVLIGVNMLRAIIDLRILESLEEG